MRCVAVLALLAGLACGSPPAPEASPQAQDPPPDLRVANAERPGEALELRAILSKDRTTLVEFYSDQCPPCREMEPVLEYLAEQNRELAIRRVDIDRRGHTGIDFDSPVAEQFGVHSVPGFHVYAPGGRLVAHGDAARAQVQQWYSEAQLFEHADDPGLRDVSERYRKPPDPE